MNKYVKQFPQRIDESIGKGSVIFIKGRPSEEGRKLYATTITGWTEIRPGLKMVFLGNQIYQVIRKPEGFFGRKVGYSSEDGLKGVLNLKNPGVPSLVLNHNKTPFHWITLKHLDVGSAIREVGNRLITHEMILESKDEGGRKTKTLTWLIEELIRYLMGEDNSIEMVSVRSDGEDLDDHARNLLDYEMEQYLTFTQDWTVEFDVAIKANALSDDSIIAAIREIEERDGVYVLRDEVLDFLGSYNDSDSFQVTFAFDTDAEVRYTSGGGGWLPEEFDVESCDNNISLISIELGKEWEELEQKDMSDLMIKFDEFITEVDPGDFEKFVKCLREDSCKEKRRRQFKAFSSISSIKSDPNYDYSDRWISTEEAEKKVQILTSIIEDSKEILAGLSIDRIQELNLDDINDAHVALNSNLDELEDLLGIDFSKSGFRVGMSKSIKYIINNVDLDGANRETNVNLRRELNQIKDKSYFYFQTIKSIHRDILNIIKDYPRNAEKKLLQIERATGIPLKIFDDVYYFSYELGVKHIPIRFFTNTKYIETKS